MTDESASFQASGSNRQIFVNNKKGGNFIVKNNNTKAQ
jgi:hypothetical protein